LVWQALRSGGKAVEAGGRLWRWRKGRLNGSQVVIWIETTKSVSSGGNELTMVGRVLITITTVEERRVFTAKVRPVRREAGFKKDKGVRRESRASCRSEGVRKRVCLKVKLVF